ncbi:DNA ligase D [Pontibacillus yanchengensis]|uniref:DNA ligase (ATP) n=1 Tax=Pontibacillus yanchengensis Y32 TaxID=1385514 RepID=A0A0A2TI70_9BACI|nr:DNA ligase D [Pontibacillus yanchengensis]KGP73761.1 ATP-dependent DNA ligase [Pontibacillus yanchengensis Y32]
MRKPMLPTLTEEVPTEEEWVYEVKYDGFRVLMHWTEDGVELWSRNGKALHDRFPEIVENCQALYPSITSHLPLWIDGELTILNTPLQGNFPLLQQRNRMRNEKSIEKAAKARPATVMCFDLLEYQGEDITSQNYTTRKQRLHSILSDVSSERLLYVPSFEDKDKLWEDIVLHLGEGMVAKRGTSSYGEGDRTRDWLKVKNWRVVSGILHTFDPSNGYYTLCVYRGDNLEMLGSFKHGLPKKDKQTLKQFFKKNGTLYNKVYRLEPSACVDVKCLHAQKDDLREPMFNSFRFDLSPEECTVEKKQWDLALFPHVDITNEDKKLWIKPTYTKQDFLLYLRNMAPYMLPFLQDKRLTVIRYPDGIHEESFYQKHLPDYAPQFVAPIEKEGETFFMCQNVSSLVWLGNQGSIEYHIPFEKEGHGEPNEIVFDLDPPDKEAFSLSVRAATLLKHLCDKLEIFVFAKTSGNKGMQLHIPIPEHSFSYDETRVFTEKLASLLVKQEPDYFTTERLKKNRGNRLYIDYVQHAEGKTIVAPYSPRATETGTVATPIFWHEVDESLSPQTFTMTHVLQRVQELGCPFADIENARKEQNIDSIKKLIDSETE